jgi:hypothetical protein
MTQLRLDDATSAYRSYLRRLANMANEHDFLFGAEACIADFAAYHPLWYTRRIDALKELLELTPAVLDWMDRMADIGHGESTPMTSAEAIEVARSASPRTLLSDSTFQDDHGIPLGSQVTVRAETFGPEETAGELVAATRMHYTLRRTDPRAGTLDVHFPRIGYVLKLAEVGAP